MKENALTYISVIIAVSSFVGMCAADYMHDPVASDTFYKIALAGLIAVAISVFVSAILEV